MECHPCIVWKLWYGQKRSGRSAGFCCYGNCLWCHVAHRGKPYSGKRGIKENPSYEKHRIAGTYAGMQCTAGEYQCIPFWLCLRTMCQCNRQTWHGKACPSAVWDRAGNGGRRDCPGSGWSESGTQGVDTAGRGNGKETLWGRWIWEWSGTCSVSAGCPRKHCRTDCRKNPGNV